LATHTLPAIFLLHVFHQLLYPAFTYAVVFCLGMVHDDGGGRLLWNQLKSSGQRHPQFLFCRQQLENLLVVAEFRDGGITPGIAFASLGAEAQFLKDVAVEIFGSGFCRWTARPWRKYASVLKAAFLAIFEALAGLEGQR